MRKFLLLLTVFLAGFSLPKGFAQTPVYPTGVSTADFGDNVAIDNLGNYYATMAAAISAANGNEAITALYCKENAASTKLANAHTKITKSLTIEGNGITFNSDVDPHMAVDGGTLNLTIRNARNCYVWGELKTTDPVEYPGTRNIVLENCVNIGTSGGNQAGRLVYLTGQGADYITNITIQNCEIGHTDSPIYSNTNGTIRIEHCNIHDCAVPININYKSNDGVQNVYVIDNTIDNCGWTTGDLATYAAPIRVVHTVAGSTQNVYISSNTVTNTIGSKGDVLLVDDRAGKTVIDNTAEISGNATDLVVLAKPIVPMQTVAANTTATVAGGPTFPAGNGSIATPYEIRTKEDLITLATVVNGGTTFAGKHFLQTADIDLTGENWTPIGNSSNPFRGIYDGGNHTISNLACTGGNCTGLFGMINEMDLEIWVDFKNLTIENAHVAGAEGTGVVAGKARRVSFSNVHVVNASVNGGKYTGGLVGWGSGSSMNNCSFEGDTVMGSKTVGGLVGYFPDGVVQNSSVIVDVVSATENAGGIVGRVGQEGSLLHCSATITGSVTASANSAAGGMIGDVVGSATAVNHNYCNATINKPLMGAWYDNSGTESSANAILKDNAWKLNSSNEPATSPIYQADGITPITNHPRFDSLVFFRSELAGLAFNPGDKIRVAQGAQLTAQEVADSIAERTGLFTGTVAEDGYTVTVTAAEFDGTGTEADPYIIDNWGKLMLLASRVNSGTTYSGAYFKQTADIDLNRIADWTPIGGVADGSAINNTRTFLGRYDGYGHTISNLTITTVRHQNGLFGAIGLSNGESGCYVKNLNIANAHVAGGSSAAVLCGICKDTRFDSIRITSSEVNADKYVAGIAGHCGATTITNCTVEVKITCSDNQAAGISAYTYGGSVVSNCVATVDITALESAGGVVGRLNDDAASILHCTSFGTVRATTTSTTDPHSGSILGDVYGTGAHHVQHCYGNATAEYPIVGAWRSGNNGTAERSNAIFVANSWDKAVFATDSAKILQNQIVLTKRPRNNNLVFYRSELDGMEIAPGATIVIAQGSALSGQEVIDTIQARTGIFSGTLSATGDTITVHVGTFAGTGTEADPYIIDNWGKLMLLAYKVNNGTNYQGAFFKQTADIDLDNMEWDPIGRSDADHSFWGHYDGFNHTISNLKVTALNAYRGLFGCSREGTIKNLTLDGVTISHENPASYDASGALAGALFRTNITNIHVRNANISGGKYLGGIVGHVYTTMRNCSFEGTVVSNSSQVGGLAGTGGLSAYNCTVNAYIKGTKQVGGLIGRLQDSYGTVAHNTVSGRVVCTQICDGLGGGAIFGDGFGNETRNITYNYCNATVVDSIAGTVTLASPVVGGWHVDHNAADEATSNNYLKNNSWNGAIYAATSVEILNGGSPAARVATHNRNNNLVFSAGELNNITIADGAVIVRAQGAEATTEQILAKIAESGLFTATSSVTGDTITVHVGTFAGSGTEADPYIIDSKGKLMLLAYKVNNGETYSGKYFKQTANIDLENMEWTPIGGGDETIGIVNPFKGKYDGDNHTISNLKNTSTRDEVGLFGCVHDAEIKNLNMDGVTLNGNRVVGAVAGKFYTSTMTNVHVTNADIDARSAYIGGLVGHGYGTFRNCSYQGNVYAYNGQAGGIAGSGGFSFYDCVVDGQIGGWYWIGGICGNLQDGSGYVSHCTVSGLVYCEMIYYNGGAGGIIGSALYNYQRSIDNNYCNAEVKNWDEDNEQWVHSDCPVIGGYNSQGPVDPDNLKLSNNSWNHTIFPIDTMNVIELDDEVVIPGSQPRNPNLVFSIEEALGVTEGEVILAQGAQATNDNIIAAVDDMPEYSYYINDRGNVVVVPNPARIDETYYTSIQAAIDAAQNGDEITILTDVDYENPFTSTSYTTILTVPAGKDITIDFNGHTVKASVDTYQNAYILTNRGTLTLIDRTAADTTDYANGEGGGFEMHSSVIENGTYGTQTDAIDNVGTLNINSGRVVAVNDAVLEAGQGYNLTYSIHAGQGTLNVNGGYIYGYAASIYQGVFNGNTSIVNIHGGEVVGRTSGIQTKMWGNVILNIDGGLVKGTRNDAIYCSDGATPFIQEINISGGKLEGANEAICNFWANTTGTISGGELIGGYGLYEYPYYGFATGVTSTWNITGGSITALEDEPENYAVFIRAFRPSRVEISDNAVINGAMVSTHKVGDNWVENTTDYLFPVGGYYQVDPVTYVADGDTTRLNIGAAEYEDYYVVVPFVNLTVNSSATPNNFTVKNITDDAHIETLAENVPTFSGRVPSGARIEVTAAETIGTDWFLGWNDNESARTRTIVPTRDTTIKALYGSVTATADTAFFSLPLGKADTIVPASWFDPSLIRVSDVSVDKVLAYVISGGNNYPYGGEESRVAGNGTIEVVWEIFQSGTNNLLCTATQVLKAVYTNCGEEITDDDNNTYNTVLMGSQCWMASNLRTNIAGSRYYNDDAENAVFGRLYNWYTAVGLTLTRSGEPVPVPDANGHVQGICPDGWRLPSVQDIHNLRTSVSSEYELRSPDYWVEAGAGTSPADGYNLLPGGSFDANANRFDGLYAAARLWTWETSSTSTMPFYGCATGACPDMEVLTTSRFSMMSVRCVKK